MSVVCGLRVGHVVVLGADTILGRQRADRDVVHIVSTDYTKIHFWGGGLISGVGLGAAVCRAATCLEVTRPRDVGGIADNLRHAWSVELAPLWNAYPVHREFLDRTTAYATLGTWSGARAYRYHPADGGLRELPARRLFGSPPSGMPENEWAGILAAHDGEAVHEWRGTVPLGALRAIAGVIAETGRRSPWVSGTADICVHRGVTLYNHITRVRGPSVGTRCR